MNTPSYWIKLLLTYAVALSCALLWLFVAFIVAYKSQWAVIVAFLIPIVAGPIVFAIALARSPWLRDAAVPRILMIVSGTVALAALYVFMYAAYGQGVALYARRTREYLQNAF